MIAFAEAGGIAVHRNFDHFHAFFEFTFCPEYPIFHTGFIDKRNYWYS